MGNQEGDYQGDGDVIYSGISKNVFSLLIRKHAIHITELNCYISDGIWHENGVCYHFQGELKLAHSE